MFEQLLAGLGLLVCLALMLRLMVGERRRQRLDDWLRVRAGRLRHGTVAAWRWPGSRKRAKQAAEDVIRRARGGDAKAGGRWDGNVYRPDNFRDRRKDH